MSHFYENEEDLKRREVGQQIPQLLLAAHYLLNELGHERQHIYSTHQARISVGYDLEMQIFFDILNNVSSEKLENREKLCDILTCIENSCVIYRGKLFFNPEEKQRAIDLLRELCPVITGPSSFKSRQDELKEEHYS